MIAPEGDTRTAIRARGLAKRYALYARPRDLVIELLTRRPRAQEHWALTDVDFSIARGETVGVLGRNGAGKSTLLKLIAGTLQKTSGELMVDGRVSAILELGTGFHPEYSGRQNISMGGLCLGMTRQQVRDRMDEIIDFSGLADVIDRPFKTYSTGMQARLTFSTAIAVDPDILLIDEALSVGDQRFQRKCFEKIDELRRSDKTVVLVSHDHNTISTFCNRALLLENGSVLVDGPPKDVSRIFHLLLFENRNLTPEQARRLMNGESIDEATGEDNSGSGTSAESGREIRFGSHEATVSDFRIVDEKGQATQVLDVGQRCSFVIDIELGDDVEDLVPAILLRNVRGTEVFGTDSLLQGLDVVRGQKGQKLRTEIDCTMWLAAGTYFVTVSLARKGVTEKFDHRYDAFTFEVLGRQDIYASSVVSLDAQMRVSEV